jgi:transcription initiation factor TFIIB
MTSVEYCNQCPECKSLTILDFSKGECICVKCGYVVEEKSCDFGPEMHSTNFEERRKNTRASGSTSFTMHDFGLRTEISSSSKDYSGRPINFQSAEIMNKIKKWHPRLRTSSSKQRRLSNVLSKIKELSSILCLPQSLVETACRDYRNFENKYEAKGKSITCIAAATIYLACKKCGVVRSLDEIVKAAGISENDRSSVKLASKYFRLMMMEMNVSFDPNYKNDASQCISNSVTFTIDNYISKLSNIAKIDTKVERLALDISHKTSNNLLADGKSPNGLAAAYIYLAAVLLGVNLLQIDISNFAGITEVTIRNRCKDILNNFKMMISVRPASNHD